LPCARHRQGFPCCHALPLPHVPTPLPRRKPTGCPVALFPASRRPSPFLRRVGSRVRCFEACSAFTSRFGPRGRWTSCRLSSSLGRLRRFRLRARLGYRISCEVLLPQCFSPCRYLHEPLWLLPAGATVAGWDSHPLGTRAFPRRTQEGHLHSQRRRRSYAVPTTLEPYRASLGTSSSHASKPSSPPSPSPPTPSTPLRAST